MAQLKVSTIRSFGSEPKDFVVTGNANIVGPLVRATVSLGPLSTFSPDLLSTAEPVSQDAISEPIKEAEQIWRSRVKASRETKPVTYRTLLNGQDFLRNIARHYSDNPEVSVFPDGELCFEWKTEKGSIDVLVDEKDIYWVQKSRNDKRRKGSDSAGTAIPRDLLTLFESIFA